MDGDMLLFYLIAGIILILIVLGILIWAVVSIAGNSKGKKVPKESAGSTASAASARGSPDRTSSTPARKPEHASQGAELLRVFRNINTGAVYVEMDGKPYHHLTDIHDPHTGRLLLQTVADLNRFTRGVTPAMPAKPAAGSPSSPAPGSLAKRGEALIKDSQPVKVEPGTIPATGSGLLERVYKLSSSPATPDKAPAPEAKLATEKPGSPGSAFEKAGQKTELGSFWGRALTPSPATGASKIGPRPLADELEDILRDIVKDLPTRPPREVHFRTAADGRLIIEVDGASYQDVTEVQDATARQMIQTVIKKWETK